MKILITRCNFLFNNKDTMLNKIITFVVCIYLEKRIGNFCKFKNYFVMHYFQNTLTTSTRDVCRWTPVVTMEIYNICMCLSCFYPIPIETDGIHNEKHFCFNVFVRNQNVLWKASNWGNNANITHLIKMFWQPECLLRKTSSCNKSRFKRTF